MKKELLIIEALQIGVQESIKIISAFNDGSVKTKESLTDLKKLLALSLMMKGEILAEESPSVTPEPN